MPSVPSPRLPRARDRELPPTAAILDNLTFDRASTVLSPMTPPRFLRLSALAATLFLSAPSVLQALPPPPDATGHQLICWASTLGGNLTCDDRGGIFVMRADGTRKRQLTSFVQCGWELEPHGLNLPDDHPAFSPDGRRIVFTSKRASTGNVDNWEIFIMSVNGGSLRRLTFSAGLDTEPVFSPNGQRIAFASARDGGVLHIFTMNLEGGDIQQLTSGSLHDVEPAWRPDGARLAFTRIFAGDNKEIMTINADGSDLKRLTNVAGEDHDPTYNPDGTRLVITSERDFTLPFGDIWIINAETGAAVTQVTNGDGLFQWSSGDPSWSPDGQKIAFFTATGPIVRLPQRLGVMNANGTGRQTFTLFHAVNVHPNMGYEVDTDRDGRPNHLETRNTALTEDFFGTPVANQRFGNAAAVVDLTTDEQPDILIGAPGATVSGRVNAGRLYFAQATLSGIDLDLDPAAFGISRTLADLGEPLSALANARFGQSIVAGRFAGGTRRVAAVAAPGRNAVYLFILAGQTASIRLTGPANSEFGEAMTVGDFNGDGFEDLAIASPSERTTSAGGLVLTRAGAVRIYYGRSTFVTNPPAPGQIIDQGHLPVPLDIGKEEENERFGESLAAGDLDGDGADELIVGVPSESVAGVQGAGVIHIIPGVPGGLLAPESAVTRDARNLPSPHNALQHQGRFGAALAAGDFNRGNFFQGAEDVAAGAPNHSANGQAGAGLVAVFNGKSIAQGRVESTASLVITPQQLGLSGPVALGSKLAAAEMTGDGPDDLAVSAPAAQGVSSNVQQAGRVYLISGSRTSISQTNINSGCTLCVDLSAPSFSNGGLIPSTAQVLSKHSFSHTVAGSERFGENAALFPSSGVLATGDLDGDGQDDLLIGCPNSTENGKQGAGALFIRFGLEVGVFTAETSAAQVSPGSPFDITLRWTHPNAWRDLATVQVRLMSDFGVVGWIRFDEATGLVSFWDPLTDTFPSSFLPGLDQDPLTQPWCDILPAGSAVANDGPGGREILMNLQLRFSELVDGQNVRIEVFATDDLGNSQGFTEVATAGVASHPEQLRILYPHFSRTGDGSPVSFDYNVAGPAGRDVILEWSGNLRDWDLFERRSNPTGILNISVPAFPPAEQLYFRARSP